MSKKQRRALLTLAWILAFSSAPYATSVAMGFNPADDAGLPITRYSFVSVGVVLLSGSLFLMALLCTKLNDELEAAPVAAYEKVREPLPNEKPEEEGLPKGYEFGLRLLRAAINSPLRGLVSEGGIILSLNGHVPMTAADANSVLVTGTNEVEWVDRQGKIETTIFLTRKKDLNAQFEQLFQKNSGEMTSPQV